MNTLPGKLAAALVAVNERVHDPFAGSGFTLGRLADVIPFEFTGTEVDPSLIVDHRVTGGDPTDSATYPEGPHTIVTSPVNGPTADEVRAALDIWSACDWCARLIIFTADQLDEWLHLLDSAGWEIAERHREYDTVALVCEPRFEP